MVQPQAAGRCPQGGHREGDAQPVPGELLATPAAGSGKLMEANQVKAAGREPGLGEAVSHGARLPAHPPPGPPGKEVPRGWPDPRVLLPSGPCRPMK